MLYNRMIVLLILASFLQVFVVSAVFAAKFVTSFRFSLCLAAFIVIIFIGLQP